MNRSTGFWLFAAALPLFSCAQAQEIEISHANCAPDMHLVARNARFSDVLKRLSEKLGFQLQFDGGRDPLIDVDVSQPAPELVVKLSPNDNIVVTQAADPHCAKRRRILKVWVLPGAGAGSLAANAAPARPAPAAARPPAPPAQSAPHYDPKRLDEMSRLRKKMYDTYVKIHGVPPPTPEEEAAK